MHKINKVYENIKCEEKGEYEIIIDGINCVLWCVKYDYDVWCIISDYLRTKGRNKNKWNEAVQ